MDSDASLRRALTRWMLLNRHGKAPATQHYHREIIHAIRRAWRDTLGRPVSALTAADCERFAFRAGHYSPSRWNAMLTVLHSITPASHTLKRRAQRLTRKPPPTQTQFQALLDECDRLPRSQARLVVDFLAHSGLRISAARRVRWEDIHADRIEYVAKGGRVCSVPIVAGMRSVLERLRQVKDGSGHVLPRAGIRRGLAKACARAGIRSLSHHDFRHLFATRCIESGVDLPTTARWLGHNDGGALLARRYFHLLDGHSAAMAARVQIRP